MGLIEDARAKRDRIREGIKKWEKITHQSGHQEAARKRLESLRRKLDRVVRRIKRLVARGPLSGTGAWGGTQSIIDNEVIPIFDKYGVPITSTKRWETYGNPDSDHYAGNTTAYAVDGGIAEAHDLLDEIALTVVGRRVNDYELVYFVRAGKNFRFQGIAATHGTGPHLHIGVRQA